MTQSNGNMDELMRGLQLEERIKEVHKAITENHTSDSISFDAWYTDTDFVLRKLLRLGREVARELRISHSIKWSKPLPNELSEKFKKAGKDSIEWEDGPDGALAGLAILLSGWVANQSAAKTRHCPNDSALLIFDNFTCPAIQYAKQYGKALANKNQKKI
jgi:hypothetical protein